jgi:hypothetical protein
MGMRPLMQFWHFAANSYIKRTMHYMGVHSVGVHDVCVHDFGMCSVEVRDVDREVYENLTFILVYINLYVHFEKRKNL